MLRVGESFSVRRCRQGAVLTVSSQQDADRIYRRGIKRNARPVERLKKHYKEFQASLSTARPPPPSEAPPRAPPTVLAPPAVLAPPTALAAPRDPFLHIHAPADPRRRPERLRFNLSLLLTEDGSEYCAAEARARSMGLLGKKWAPDLQAVAGPSALAGNGRKSVAMRYEPTVTINTKEALADVFGMYNSPEKTLRIERPGSKHAPVTKIELRMEPLTPAPSLRFSPSDENASVAKTPGEHDCRLLNILLSEWTTPQHLSHSLMKMQQHLVSIIHSTLCLSY